MALFLGNCARLFQPISILLNFRGRLFGQFETLANNPARQKAEKCTKCPQPVIQCWGWHLRNQRGRGDKVLKVSKPVFRPKNASLNKKDQE